MKTVYRTKYLIDVNEKISYIYVEGIKVCHIREEQVYDAYPKFLMENKKVPNFKEYCEGNYIKIN